MNREKTKNWKISRGPFDGFLEAFYRSPTDAGTRERKPPRIQRLAETSLAPIHLSLGELKPVRKLPPRQTGEKIFWEKESSGTVGELWNPYISLCVF